MGHVDEDVGGTVGANVASYARIRQRHCRENCIAQAGCTGVFIQPIAQRPPVALCLGTRIADGMDMAIIVGAVPLAALDRHLTALDLQHQDALRVRDDEIGFADAAAPLRKPLDAVEHGEGIRQRLKLLGEQQFGVAGGSVGPGPAMDPAAIEAHQIADREIVGAFVEFAHAQRRDAEGVLHVVGRVLPPGDKPGLAEMHITPRHAADQRELVAAHVLGFVLADAEVLRQPVEHLGARDLAAITADLQEGQQELVLGRNGHRLVLFAGVFTNLRQYLAILHTVAVVHL